MAALAGGARPAVSTAQSRPAAYPDTVVEVRVEGNRILSESAVLAYVKIRPGQPFSQQVIRDDEQRLLKTRRFDNVVATRTQTDRGVIVTFTVTERPVVEGLFFEGNKAVQTKELERAVAFGPQDPLDRYQIDSGLRAIQAKYRARGYQQTTVEIDEHALSEKRIVVYRITEGSRTAIRKVRFEGNRSFSAFRLQGIVSTRARLWPFLAGVLDAETVERDVVDLRNFYRGQGFLDAEVGRRLDFSPDKQDVTVTFTINERSRYHIRDVLFEGNRVFADEEIRGPLKLLGGAGFNGLVLQRDLETIRDLYGEIGFIYAQVTVRTRYAAPPTQPEEEAAQPALVDLVYSITESEQFRVGLVQVRGNEVTRHNVIRRHIQVAPGQDYNTRAIEETRRRLLETRLFDEVTITPSGDAPGVRDAVVEVTEARTGEFLIGASISSNVGLLGNISYTERNFDIFGWPRSGEDVRRGRAFRGAGQVFSITAEPGLQFSRFRLDWSEPYLMDLPFSLGAGAFAFTSERETYEETRYGGYASFGHRFPNRWYTEVAGRAEGVNVGSVDDDAPQDVLDVKGTNFLTGVKGTLARDNTDSRWLPSKGDRLNVSYEQVMGDFTFGKAVGDYHIYHTVYRDALDRKHILAGRGMVGNIFGDAPVFERFYGGGLGSVRGFKYRGISPRQGPDDDPVGGQFMMFLGGEYTFPVIAENLRGVVFLDSGTVEKSAGIVDYRVSAGFGLRLHVPFFGPVPMSLDFGFPISKGPHDDTQLVSFSFGWVF